MKNMSMKKKRKKAISPVIATVLLVAMVIVIGLIIFSWAKGFQEEAVTKFGGENIELTCEKVTFEADYSGGTLFLSNLGNVPIFQIKAKIYKDGSHETKDLGGISSKWYCRKGRSDCFYLRCRSIRRRFPIFSYPNKN